jgi:energy-coupling factor transport system ATP-binding protein
MGVGEDCSSYAVAVEDLWFRYPHSGWVLRGLSLRVKRGETVLVIGPSGSGKTTLLRALTGIGRSIYGGRSKGQVLLCGKSLEEYSLEELRRVIQVVNQNVYTHFIEHNIGSDLATQAHNIHGETWREELEKVVNALGLRRVLDKYFFELSGGQLRRAAVAKALLWDPEILIFDEPLMWLDDEGTRDFLAVLEHLKSAGKTVIVFEHRFLPLLGFVDSVYMLKNGVLSRLDKSAFTRSSQQLSNEPSSLIIDDKGDKLVLAANDLQYSYDGELVIRDASMRVSRGETVVVYGRNGSGKSTLLKLLAGYLKPVKGTITRRGRVFYIPQNVYLFFTEESLRKEAYTVCRAWGKGGKCIEEVFSWLNRLGLRGLEDASPFKLSWGQAVRAAIAILLAVSDSDTVLLLDEPFTGLTYSDRSNLARLLIKLNTSKVITLSSLESLVFVRGAKVYTLSDGVLKKASIVPPYEPLGAARILEQLYGRGVD